MTEIKRSARMCNDSEENMSASLTRIMHQVSRALDLNQNEALKTKYIKFLYIY